MNNREEWLYNSPLSLLPIVVLLLVGACILGWHLAFKIEAQRDACVQQLQSYDRIMEKDISNEQETLVNETSD